MPSGRPDTRLATDSAEQLQAFADFPMKTHVHLELSQPEALPARFQQDDVRYPESLVEYFLQAYTQAGDTVLDPFMGTASTNIAASRWGRNSVGIEVDSFYFENARQRLDAQTRGLFRETAIQSGSRMLQRVRR